MIISKHSRFKIILFLLVTTLLISVFTGCSSSKLPDNANDDELKLINYIIENGEYNSEEKTYTIQESANEAGMNFTYGIRYSEKTKKLTFIERSSISSGTTYTYMHYEYGAKSQKVEIKMEIGSSNTITASGIIYPATYTQSNQTISSFESSYSYATMQSICEGNVYTMLTHCQLLMIDADTGLVPFGFEKGLFK